MGGSRLAKMADEEEELGTSGHEVEQTMLNVQKPQEPHLSALLMALLAEIPRVAIFKIQVLMLRRASPQRFSSRSLG